jgi:hypothetical protein
LRSADRRSRARYGGGSRAAGREFCGKKDSALSRSIPPTWTTGFWQTRGVESIHHAIQYYRPTEPYDVIVNDLTMDARDSVIAMLAMRRISNPGGPASSR